jgi:hypothetical protein
LLKVIPPKKTKRKGSYNALARVKSLSTTSEERARLKIQQKLIDKYISS